MGSREVQAVCSQDLETVPRKAAHRPVKGWESVIHPEGALYFYNSTRRVFTDANLRDPSVLKIVNNRVGLLLLEAGDAVDTLTYLAVELDQKSGVCNYYFVQHDKRLLFWVQTFNEPMRIYEHVKGVKSDTHIKVALEAQYWMHCELYPSNAPIQPQIVTELKYVLLHAHADFLTSDTSVVPYDSSTLQSMLDLTNQVVDYVSQTQTQTQTQCFAMPSSEDTVTLPAHLMCVLARLMRLFARSKFLNFYGQVSARLSANQSVYDSEHTRGKGTTRLLLANIFLCGAPAAQYKFLRDTWIDDILNYPRWSKYISRLNGDWSNVTIFSTVMLAVDISFMAVPGVVSATVMFICLSTMCSVSSLAVSMILGGKSRGWGTDSAAGAASFMAQMVHTQTDIEALAIMYSLPYAFLIWGMLCFVAALGITVFRFTHPVILVFVSLGWVVVTVLTLWPAWWGKLSITPSSALSRKRGQARRPVA
ncbi:hypothetical protein K503DRAFT_529099 [Rhizopogon vinicolor AM-OR11-026]|uniref:WW domain-containing protein n=1 Tax=Rhizopogon vinicolor AM-OR11-026 TaxID=1314800 RepID=A0A1B7ML93_9AGAM|nr:hypothetical protein K503DRAFT_529099 [Rhizopogon vinicolor AM-OR11-026]